VLLEAQRDLAYTTLSIKQIALGLGFGDAGYFTRFFQRLSGRTPTQWRGQAYAARA
jgi:AraC family transcriptional activator of pobA